MSDKPTPPGRILILGGGTAGWMTAVSLANAWQTHPVKIQLMESAEIGIIGVGEGSTPKMRRYFEGLGIAETEWMPACNATYKCGIRFPLWSTRKGYRSYYHPFFSLSDDQSVRAFYQNATLRNGNVDVPAHPDAFFVSQYLAKNARAPIPPAGLGYETDYAYHFDANLIGQFLKQKAMALGVEHLIDTVQSVERNEHGDISGVVTAGRGLLEADFFVDCTGFASVLIGKTLGVEFLSYDDLLFNDAAVALPTPLDADAPLPSETKSTALSSGWVWKIPLTNRFGNGYVYSSRYLDKEAAEKELRDHIGLQDASVEARHLRMRVGRVTTAWHRNCLAVGLSQGFIEPLEATALMIVQETIETFIQRFSEGAFTDRYRDSFNDKVNLVFDSIRDYIFMHYKLNSRSDTRYWIDNRENDNGSDSVKAILEVWDQGGDLLGELQGQGQRLAYSPTSWYCILAGMGRFPSRPKRAKRNVNASDPNAVRDYCERMISRFPDHRELIGSMAAS
jgi:2-polyprenyl-6-methoxyphenol hydroxylase-like FAD-dependent oxidoreductase